MAYFQVRTVSCREGKTWASLIVYTFFDSRSLRSQWSNLGITGRKNSVSKKSTFNMPQVLPSDPFGESKGHLEEAGLCFYMVQNT